MHHLGTCSTSPSYFTTDVRVCKAAARALATLKKQYGAENALTARPASQSLSQSLNIILAAPARQAAAAGAAVDDWSDSEDRRNLLDDNDEMNVDCDPYTKAQV